MKSHVTKKFRRLFGNLPTEIRQGARESYRLWKENPAHPSLQFKRVHQRPPIYSVRVGIGWRAVGLREGNTIIWFWIGSHAEYDQLLKRL